VKEAAHRLGLPVGHRVDDVLTAGVELGIVVAYGALVRPHVLAAVPMVNLHFSLLPRWRGAAPVERAVLAGDHETGVCLMQLEEGLDTGPVYARVGVPIAPDETAASLRHRLVEVGARLLVERLVEGLRDPVPQTGEVSYAAKLDPAEFELRFARSAVELDRIVRVGGAWTTFRGRRLKVLRAEVVPAGAGEPGEPGELLDASDVVIACGDGTALRLVEVQPEGRSAQPTRAWANGARPARHERFGS
jgi:methionyl-tRNA formyltransferase